MPSVTSKITGGELSEYEVEEHLKALILIWWFVNIIAFVYWLMCVFIYCLLKRKIYN